MRLVGAYTRFPRSRRYTPKGSLKFICLCFPSWGVLCGRVGVSKGRLPQVGPDWSAEYSHKRAEGNRANAGTMAQARRRPTLVLLRGLKRRSQDDRGPMRNKNTTSAGGRSRSRLGQCSQSRHRPSHVPLPGSGASLQARARSTNRCRKNPSALDLDGSAEVSPPSKFSVVHMSWHSG